MINTFHTSYNNPPMPVPPPVPPRQGHRGSMLPGNTPLVKFLSVMMLLLMLLTFGGFLYLFHRLSVQLPFDVCMTSSSGSLTPEQREYCQKLVESSWAEGNDGKVAFLSGQGYYILPVARLVLRNKTSNSNVQDQQNILYWDQSQSLAKKINLDSSGRITVVQPGYYFIHSQISFSKAHPKTLLKQVLWTLKPQKDHEQEECWEILLTSYCSLPRNSPLPDTCTASQAGVFHLEKNQKLRVNVTSQDLVNKESSTFGMFKLLD